MSGRTVQVAATVKMAPTMLMVFLKVNFFLPELMPLEMME